MIDCHHERSEGSRFLHEAAVTVAQANTQIPRFGMTMCFWVSGAIRESTDVVRIIRSHSNASLLRI